MMPSRCECGRIKRIDRKLCDACAEDRARLLAMNVGLSAIYHVLSGGTFNDIYPANTHEEVRENEYRAHGV